MTPQIEKLARKCAERMSVGHATLKDIEKDVLETIPLTEFYEVAKIASRIKKLWRVEETQHAEIELETALNNLTAALAKHGCELE